MRFDHYLLSEMVRGGWLYRQTHDTNNKKPGSSLNTSKDDDDDHDCNRIFQANRYSSNNCNFMAFTYCDDYEEHRIKKNYSLLRSSV